MVCRSSSSCFLFLPQTLGPLGNRKAGQTGEAMQRGAEGRGLRDGRLVDGAHGWGEGPVQGVVEDRGADVGHDGVQQRLAQILLLGGNRRGRRRRLKQTGILSEPRTAIKRETDGTSQRRNFVLTNAWLSNAGTQRLFYCTIFMILNSEVRANVSGNNTELLASAVLLEATRGAVGPPKAKERMRKNMQN